MASISISPNFLSVKESFLPQEATLAPKENNQVAAGEALNPGGKIKTEEGGAAFRKLFLEKKAERDAAAAVKNDRPEKAEGGAVLAKSPFARNRTAEAAARAAQTSAGGKNEKTSTLKNILSSLIPRKNKTEESEKKEKISDKENLKRNVGTYAERSLGLQERLAQARKKDPAAPPSLEQAEGKISRVKPEKQVVIVDLRDRPAEKPKAAARPAKASLKTLEKDETPAPGKNTESGERFETKVFLKNTPASPAAETEARAPSGESERAGTELSARFQEVMRNEMVKHTGLVLKNGGNGEIHLVLKPESLGSVRIKLNLEDNHIAGKIIVDNESVKKIMEENLGHLETALRDSGYETAGFDVFVAGEKRHAPEGENDFQSWLTGEDKPFSTDAGRYETGGSSVYDDRLVNIIL